MLSFFVWSGVRHKPTNRPETFIWANMNNRKFWKIHVAASQSEISYSVLFGQKKSQKFTPKSEILKKLIKIL